MFWRLVFLAMFSAGLPTQAPPAGTPFHISGVLVDAVSGHPISQARVAIAPVTDYAAAITVSSGEDGQFAFSNLKPGKYNLRAQRRGYLAHSFNEHEGFSTAIAVGPDLESGNLIFRLPPESSISGRVSDEAGEPVGSAQVHVYQTGFSGGREGIHVQQVATTDDEGLYHVGHLSPGKYLVAVLGAVWYAQRPQSRQEPISSASSSAVNSVSTPGNYSEDQGRSSLDLVYPITFYPGVTDANEAATITLKAGDQFVADLSLQPVPALRILIPGGAKTEGNTVTPGFVQLQSRILDELPFHVPAESRFLPSGDIEMTGIAPGRYETEVFNTGQNGQSNRKRSGEMEILANGEVHMEREVTSVEVTATLQQGPGTAKPSAGYLSLHSVKTREVSGGQIAASGEVEFHEVKPGRYEVFLNGNNDFIKTISAVGGTVSGRTLEIKGPGPVKMSVTIAHGRGDVSGIALRDGKPAAGVMLVLVPSDATASTLLFRRDQSDSDGTFTLRSVVPGKYTLLALEKGWDMEWSNPAVLKSYLPGGEVLQVQPEGKYQVKAKVQ